MSVGIGTSTGSKGDALRVGVFFSYRVGLGTWEKLGTISREVRLYQELHARGIKSVLFTWDRPEELVRFRGLYPNFEIYSWRQRGPAGLYDALRSFISVLMFRSEISSVDLIKSYQLMGSWQAVLASLIYGKKYFLRVGYDLYEFHKKKGSNLFKKCLVYWVCRLAYRQAHAILVTTPMTRIFAVANYRPVAPIEVQSNFVDERIFAPGTAPQSREVIYVGRLDAHKSLDRLLELCSFNHWSATIIGEGCDRTDLEGLARSLKVDVEFVGRVRNEDLPEILRRHRFFVLLSKSEGNPKALLEALSCGLIPIGADSPGIKEIVSEIDPGLILRNYSSEEFKRIRDRVADPTYVAEKSKRARDYVLRTCSLRSAVDTEYGILLGLMG